MKPCKNWLLATLLIMGIPYTCGATTIEEIKAACENKLQNVVSATADITMSMTVVQPDGDIEINSSGNISLLMQNGTEHSRSEITIETTFPEMGDTKQHVISIFVGDKSLVLMDMMGMKMYMQDVDDESPFTTLSLNDYLSELEKENTLTALDDHSLDGHALYVVKTIPKTPATETMLGAEKYYISKESGFPVKIELLDENNQKTGEILIKNLKTNIDLDMGLFAMTAPPGYTQMDPSEMRGGI